MAEAPFRLLFVDDEPAILGIYRRIFRDKHEVLTADGGAAALEVLRKTAVDVVVSDQRMPEVSGVEVLSFARKTQPEAARILVTAYADMESLMRSVNEAGIFKYIPKPFEPETLIAAVSEALARCAAERKLKALTPTPAPAEFLAQCERDFNIVRRLSTDILAAHHTVFRHDLLERVLHIYSMFFRFHFEHQERFMVTAGYPGADAHAAEHREFAAGLERLRTAFEAGKDVYDAVRKFYTELVDGHFAGSDAVLAAWARREKIDPPAPGR